MSPARLVWRLLGLAARGWYWLLRGRFARAAAVLREMLALKSPELPVRVLEVRTKLIGDLAEATLLRGRQALEPGAEAERAWREVADQLIAEGWERERVEAWLGLKKASD